jgi:hypothetical protein
MHRIGLATCSGAMRWLKINQKAASEGNNRAVSKYVRFAPKFGRIWAFFRDFFFAKIACLGMCFSEKTRALKIPKFHELSGTSIVVSTPRCGRGDPSSILGFRRVFFPFFLPLLFFAPPASPSTLSLSLQRWSLSSVSLLSSPSPPGKNRSSHDPRTPLPRDPPFD